MTAPEPAARTGLGLDASTAYRSPRAGRRPGVRVGGDWLLDRERVERCMMGQEGHRVTG